MSELMTVAQARAILGPEAVAEIESRPPVERSPERIARVAPILRAVLDRQTVARESRAA